MRPLFSSKIKHALLFFSALLVSFNLKATPGCQNINGIRYCNTDFWIGADNLVGTTSVSSLPSGEVTITERNICSATYHGGSLYQIEQFLQWYTSATSVNGEIWGQHPATPPSIRETTGQTINSYGPNFPEFGRTVTFKNIFTPAMYAYYMICHYSLCTEEGPNVDRCDWNAPGYLIGINIGSTPPAVDLAAGPISIPGARTSVNDGLPIIPVGVPTQINVHVSISFTGTLPSEILNSSVPLTLQVGSYSSTQNISVASLVANQNQMLVPFWVTFIGNDVGLKTLLANVNAGRSVPESNFSNNEALLNVHVGDGYKLNVSVLDLTNSNLCKTLIGPDNGTFCQSGDIRDGSVLDVPFGAHLNFELHDKADRIIPATYQLISGTFIMPDNPDSVTIPREKIKLETYSLYPDRIALLFDQDEQKSSQRFITVHMGAQKLRITPLGMPAVTVVLHSFGVKIGTGQNSYDKLINVRAHKIGLPPQYIKGEILQEASLNADGSLNEESYRYEPRTNDIDLIQPKLVTSDGILKFDTRPKKFNVENIRYNNYLFRHSDRLSKSEELINKRSLYEVKFDKNNINIPINYETTIKPNEYTPLYISDIASANTDENWNLSTSNINGSKNKVAQTIISGSYGLWQILYTTAVGEAGFIEDGSRQGKDPLLLFDPKINLQYGGIYLIKCVRRVNGLQTIKINPFTSIDHVPLFC